MHIYMLCILHVYIIFEYVLYMVLTYPYAMNTEVQSSRGARIDAGFAPTSEEQSSRGGRTLYTLASIDKY